MTADAALVHEIRALLAERGDPEKAPGQQAYMKSELPYRGLTSPVLRATLRPVLSTYAPVDRDEHEATVRMLWDEATHREEWYAAIALVRSRAGRGWLDPDGLPLLRHLVVTGAWWDVVDDVATHPVADTLAAHREVVTPVMHAWAVDENLWLRRTAVLCQVGARVDLDQDLLVHAVEANVEDGSFWLRKAIGWALRDHARTDADWVRAEVERLDGRLSGLSRREALKHLA